MSSRSRVEFDDREFYREAPRRRERDDVDVRIIERERERDRTPAFLREDRRPEPGPLVLRQREVETAERRRRSPSPVRVRETRIVERARSVSPAPPRRNEDDIRFRTVLREPSRGPDIERLRTRIVERDRSPSPSPVRARIIERPRSPSPVRERIRIVERERERERPRTPTPEPPPPAPQPQVIQGPIIERQVITHYKDIDHGVVSLRGPSPAPVRPREREREREHDTEIDIYTSRNETEVDIHKHSSRSRSRMRGRSRSRERVSHPHPTHSYDDEVLIHADRKHLHIDIDAHRSSSRNRRAHSAAPIYNDYEDESREITSKLDSRGKMGEAWNGITKDWTIVDVPPGTERVRMDGAGGASAEVTWQKYSGVRRSKFIPDRDDKGTIVSSATSVSDRDVGDSRRESRLSVAIYDKDRDRDREIDIEKTVEKRPRRSEMWTEITKDLVIREAIEEMGYEYEETEFFYYIMTYLRYEDVLQLVQLSDAVRRARKERVTEIQWERGYQDEWDREYRVHAHSHHHHHDSSSRRKRHDDERTVEREISYEHRGSSRYR